MSYYRKPDINVVHPSIFIGMITLRPFAFFSLVLLFMVQAGSSPAQDSTAILPKTTVQLQFINDNGRPSMHFSIYTTEGYTKMPVEFAVVNLFFNEESKLGMLGNITTDKFGEGVVPLAGGKFDQFSEAVSAYDLIGSQLNDPRFAGTQTTLHLQRAQLRLSFIEKDSSKVATATLLASDSAGRWIPVAGVPVQFSVADPFCLLPSVSTDNFGQASLTLPDRLMGNPEGVLNITATVNNHPQYGTLIASAEKKWGIVVAGKATTNFLSLSMLIAIWVVILYLVGRFLLRLKQMHRQ